MSLKHLSKTQCQRVRKAMMLKPVSKQSSRSFLLLKLSASRTSRLIIDPKSLRHYILDSKIMPLIREVMLVAGLDKKA